MILREQGHQALTLDDLCKAIGKTKGSFYHHFVDIGALHSAVIEAWTDAHTERPIELASSAKNVAARLDQVVHALDHAVDRSMRAWALYDEAARRAVKRVDRRRIEFLSQLHREAGHRDPELLAELEYVAFLGAQQIDAFTKRSRAVQLRHAMTRALTLLANDAPDRQAK